MDLLDINRINLSRNLPNHDVPALKRRMEAGRSDAGRKTAGSLSARGRAIDKNSKLYKVCQDFESIFIKQMLNTMRKTINKSGLLDGGMAEEIFEDMLYDKYALKMSQSAQFGISDLLYRELGK